MSMCHFMRCGKKTLHIRTRNKRQFIWLSYPMTISRTRSTVWVRDIPIRDKKTFSDARDVHVTDLLPAFQYCVYQSLADSVHLDLSETFRSNTTVLRLLPAAAGVWARASCYQFCVSTSQTLPISTATTQSDTCRPQRVDSSTARRPERVAPPQPPRAALPPFGRPAFL